MSFMPNTVSVLSSLLHAHVLYYYYISVLAWIWITLYIYTYLYLVFPIAQYTHITAMDSFNDHYDVNLKKARAAVLQEKGTLNITIALLF